MSDRKPFLVRYIRDSYGEKTRGNPIGVMVGDDSLNIGLSFCNSKSFPRKTKKGTKHVKDKWDKQEGIDLATDDLEDIKSGTGSIVKIPNRKIMYYGTENNLKKLLPTLQEKFREQLSKYYSERLTIEDVENSLTHTAYLVKCRIDGCYYVVFKDNWDSLLCVNETFKINSFKLEPCSALKVIKRIGPFSYEEAKDTLSGVKI